MYSGCNRTSLQCVGKEYSPLRIFVHCVEGCLEMRGCHCHLPTHLQHGEGECHGILGCRQNYSTGENPSLPMTFGTVLHLSASFSCPANTVQNKSQLEILQDSHRLVQYIATIMVPFNTKLRDDSLESTIGCRTGKLSVFKS